MMVIEERKRARDTEHDEEDQKEATQKAPEQPLNFKKKNKGKYLSI